MAYSVAMQSRRPDPRLFTIDAQVNVVVVEVNQIGADGRPFRGGRAGLTEAGRAANQMN
jgi:hypothetical protein